MSPYEAGVSESTLRPVSSPNSRRVATAVLLLSLSLAYPDAEGTERAPATPADPAVEAWLEDPGSALSDGRVPEAMRPVVLKRWLESDPKAASGWIVSVARESIEDSLVREALVLASEESPRLAIDLGSVLDERERDSVVSRALRAWVRRDHLAALAWFEAAATRELKDRFARRLARWYASEAPEDALRWVLSLPVADARYAIRGIFEQAAERDIESALGMLPRVADPDVRTAAAASVLSRWVRVAPSPAEEWLRSYPDITRRDDLYMTLFSLWALSDLAAAAAHLDHVPREEDQTAATMGVLWLAIERNPRLAEQLYHRLPEEVQKLPKVASLLHAARDRIDSLKAARSVPWESAP